MKEQRHYYLIRLQFLGFRYSGWQRQPGQKTIESMLVKTLKFILPDKKFKIIGAGRTDAKVSALDAAFELFIEGEPLEDKDYFIEQFNKNLPPDIRIISITLTNKDFNVIKDGRSKEYVYLFSFGEKNHPFCAPFLTNVIEELDIKMMTKAAKLFEGTHDFSTYTARLQKNTKVIRTIALCEIRTNTIVKANFFPDKTYALIVRGEGFMRYQIRMMMGALIQLGKGELCHEDVELSLKVKNKLQLNYVAPGSGLFLNKLEFDQSF